jgi:hypothetical protein
VGPPSFGADRQKSWGRSVIGVTLAPGDAGDASAAGPAPAHHQRREILQQDAQFTFDSFVVGPGNRMAAAAARRVAEAPRIVYNPLFVYGGAGHGKTHLLLAMAHLARAVRPDLRVLYLPADALVDRVSSAVATGALEALQEELLDTDLVLLDDVHLLAGRSRTQEALLRLWDALEEASQIVAASRGAPGEMEGLDEELRARMARGLAVDVPPPHPETRLGIVSGAAEARGITLLDGVGEALARVPDSGPRELIAMVERVGEAQAREGRPLAPAEAAAIAGETGGERAAMDEFSAFLSDISATVEEIVETAPWRKRLAEVILRWEGEGIRTRRLEEALEADSAPDVDALVQAFTADATRLAAVARELQSLGSDTARSPVLRDPDRLGEAEAMLLNARAAAERQTEEEARSKPAVDRWFFNAEKVAWSWPALEDRLVEELG